MSVVGVLARGVGLCLFWRGAGARGNSNVEMSIRLVFGTVRTQTLDGQEKRAEWW